MKSLKFFFVLFATILTLSASSQNISTNVYYSTGNTHIVGADLLVTYPSNLVVGIGGSHATKTFFTSEKKDGNDFTDANKNIAPLTYGIKLFNTFVEDRGSVSGLLGYSFNDQKTTIVADLGIAFKQRINLFTSAPFNSANLYPHNTLEYNSHGSSAFTYGGTIIQNLKGRFGLMAGYNNIQKFKFGINYQISPTKMFKW